MNDEIDGQYAVDWWEKLRTCSCKLDKFYGIRLKLSDGTVTSTTSRIETDVIEFKVCFEL